MKNTDVTGIFYNEMEFKLGQYADDAFLLLDGSHLSLRTTMQILKDFALVSGLHCNVLKSKAIWIGNKKYSNEKICPEIDINWSMSNFRLLGVYFSLNLEDMVELNYSMKLKEVKKLLGWWSRRNLSLIGKITLIKSLLLPKFIHLFAALPNPPPHIEKELNTLFFQFIWGSKTERVKRDTLIASFEEGGLNMIHLHSFVCYIKLSWIRRLLINKDGLWQKLVSEHILGKFGGMLLLSLGKTKLKVISKLIKNNFWRDVIYALSQWKNEPSTVNEYLSQDILNLVTVDHFKSYTRWRTNGIVMIQHLFDAQGSLLSFDEIKQKTKINNFIQYFALISKISVMWKKKIKTFFESGNDFLVALDKTSLLCVRAKNKFIYKDLIRTKIIKPNGKLETWSRQLECAIGANEWTNSFASARFCTKDTKLISFNFRFLHRNITTNQFLKKINLSDNDKCTFCNKEIEEIEHLFYDCLVTENFWKLLVEWIQTYDPNFRITRKDVFLGNNNFDDLINFLILLAKYVIYRSRCASKNPNLTYY